MEVDAGESVLDVVVLLAEGLEGTFIVRAPPPRMRSSSASAERPSSVYKPWVGPPELSPEASGGAVNWCGSAICQANEEIFSPQGSQGLT